MGTGYMIIGHLFKKGTLQTSVDGSHVLLNKDNVPYTVDKADITIWNQCTSYL